jgi:hypothetical protein
VTYHTAWLSNRAGKRYMRILGVEFWWRGIDEIMTIFFHLTEVKFLAIFPSSNIRETTQSFILS